MELVTFTTAPTCSNSRLLAPPASMAVVATNLELLDTVVLLEPGHRLIHMVIATQFQDDMTGKLWFLTEWYTCYEPVMDTLDSECRGTAISSSSLSPDVKTQRELETVGVHRGALWCLRQTIRTVGISYNQPAQKMRRRTSQGTLWCLRRWKVHHAELVKNGEFRLAKG